MCTEYVSESRFDDMPLEKYIRTKLIILRRDFGLALDESEIKHMQSLKSDIQVDNYARDLINKR